MRIAGSTDSVAVVDARPAALIFGDDSVGVVVADLGRVDVVASERGMS
jgi:hypothetical protein